MIKRWFKKRKYNNQCQNIVRQTVLINQALDEYIQSELFNKIFIIHPSISPDGKFNCAALSSFDTKNVIFLDRNLFGHYLSALKKGTFDGTYKKVMVALLIWAGIHQVQLSPYYAIVEAAYSKQDDIKVNKEMTLFDYIFSTVSPQLVADSFSKDGISFNPITFQDCEPKTNLKILDDKWDFLLLYAAMLHFGYVLRTNTKPLDILHSFLDWYFETEVISVFMVTYVVLYCANKGMTPPHNYLDDKLIIDGCMNQARDLYLLQELDQDRYVYHEYTLMVATEEKRIAQIMSTVVQFSLSGDVNVLFRKYNTKVQGECAEYLKNLWIKRKPHKFSTNQTLNIAKKQVEEEKNHLSELIK